ncbi:hypothetical protein FB446DRAFT_724329 [Lentinula raphanica]|nr:hypothetical protein FB446DRAFT_724329 [Lentinula raphanica]
MFIMINMRLIVHMFMHMLMLLRPLFRQLLYLVHVCLTVPSRVITRMLVHLPLCYLPLIVMEIIIHSILAPLR